MRRHMLLSEIGITSTLFSIQHALTEAWELAPMREIIHRLKGNKLPETFSTLLSHVQVIPDTFLKGGVKQRRDNEEIRLKDDLNPERTCSDRQIRYNTRTNN